MPENFPSNSKTSEELRGQKGQVLQKETNHVQTGSTADQKVIPKRWVNFPIRCLGARHAVPGLQDDRSFPRKPRRVKPKPDRIRFAQNSRRGGWLNLTWVIARSAPRGGAMRSFSRKTTQDLREWAKIWVSENLQVMCFRNFTNGNSPILQISCEVIPSSKAPCWTSSRLSYFRLGPD